MKRIAHQEYTYKGFTIYGADPENERLDWRVYNSIGQWEISLPLKRDCKDWIDQRGA